MTDMETTVTETTDVATETVAEVAVTKTRRAKRQALTTVTYTNGDDVRTMVVDKLGRGWKNMRVRFEDGQVMTLTGPGGCNYVSECGMYVSQGENTKPVVETTVTETTTEVAEVVETTVTDVEA